MASEPAGLTTTTQGFLKALASQTRQDIMLLFYGDMELTVGEVAERMSLAQSATSNHLAVLRDAGVLTSRREWKAVKYRADPEGIHRGLDGLRDYLLACCPPEGDCT